MSPKNEAVSCNSIIYVSDSVIWFFLSYEKKVELLITNRDFPTIGSQLPHHHSKVVARLNDKKMLSNNGTRVYIAALSPRAKEFDVERLFKGFDNIRDLNIKKRFDDARDADDAVFEIKKQSLCGGRITVEHAEKLFSQKTLTMTEELTDTMAAEAVMAAAASMTETGPNTVRLQGPSTG